MLAGNGNSAPISAGPRLFASSSGSSSEAGKGTLYGGKEAKANAKAVAGLGGVFASVPGTIGQLIFTGVF